MSEQLGQPEGDEPKVEKPLRTIQVFLGSRMDRGNNMSTAALVESRRVTGNAIEKTWDIQGQRFQTFTNIRFTQWEKICPIGEITIAGEKVPVYQAGNWPCNVWQ